MRARRKDANHADVLDGVRAEGWSVLDLAQYGCSVDALVSKGGLAALLEVKDGGKPASARQLTEHELELKANWDGYYIVALNPDDAVKLLSGLEALHVR